MQLFLYFLEKAAYSITCKQSLNGSNNVFWYVDNRLSDLNHVTQIQWTDMQLLLQVAYNDETTGLRSVVRIFFALSFLRPDRTEDQIENGVERSDCVTVFNSLVIQFYALQSETLPIATLTQFVTYFTNTWMSNTIRWNVFHLDDHRTNNDLEGTFIQITSLINNFS